MWMRWHRHSPHSALPLPPPPQLPLPLQVRQPAHVGHVRLLVGGGVFRWWCESHMHALVEFCVGTSVH